MTPRSAALQGFLLTPIAMAVQGLLGGDMGPLPPVEQTLFQRPGVTGSGPGTQISLGDYLKQLRRGAALPPVDTAIKQAAARKKRSAALRRQEEEIQILSAGVI